MKVSKADKALWLAARRRGIALRSTTQLDESLRQTLNLIMEESEPWIDSRLDFESPEWRRGMASLKTKLAGTILDNSLFGRPYTSYADFSSAYQEQQARLGEVSVRQLLLDAEIARKAAKVAHATFPKATPEQLKARISFFRDYSPDALDYELEAAKEHQRLVQEVLSVAYQRRGYRLNRDALHALTREELQGMILQYKGEGIPHQFSTKAKGDPWMVDPLKSPREMPGGGNSNPIQDRVESNVGILDEACEHLAPEAFHDEVAKALANEDAMPSAPSEAELRKFLAEAFVDMKHQDQMSDVNPIIKTQEESMSTTKTTLNMAKGALIEGGKLATAKRANMLACRAATAGAKKAGVPEEFLNMGGVQVSLSVVSPLLIHFMATNFSQRVPKAELLQAACEKAMTVASMEATLALFEPLLEAMLPALGEMALAMTDAAPAKAGDTSPERTLEEPREPTMEDVLKTTVGEPVAAH